MRHERDGSVLYVVGKHTFGVFIGEAWFTMPFCIHIVEKLGQHDSLRSVKEQGHHSRDGHERRAKKSRKNRPQN